MNLYIYKESDQQVVLKNNYKIHFSLFFRKYVSKLLHFHTFSKFKICL